jgi:integrase/recombinase XerD
MPPRHTNVQKFISRIDPAIERIWRENLCLTEGAISVYRMWVRRFVVDYCGSRKLERNVQLTLVGTRVFAKWYSRRRQLPLRKIFPPARSALGTYAAALRSLGETLPAWAPIQDVSSSLPPLVGEFARHLREHRGNPPSTIHKKTQQVRTFVAFLHGRRRRPHQTRLQDLDEFLIRCRRRYARATVADIGSTLRSFMRFLLATGRVSVDLAPSIAMPIVRRLERPHRTLPWEDVRRILRAVDRSSPCGRRDYALLLMMSTYGMGAGEVIRLTLDDVDWQASTVHVVRPKTGVEFLLPLLPAVARALVSYLRRGRPLHARTRHLFVTMRAPHQQLACSVTIRHILHTHAQRAGVSAPFLGTHVLRHTHACRQMELGTRTKVIGDILGHRNSESTSAYLRVSTERLRQIALPVPR